MVQLLARTLHNRFQRPRRVKAAVTFARNGHCSDVSGLLCTRRLAPVRQVRVRVASLVGRSLSLPMRSPPKRQRALAAMLPFVRSTDRQLSIFRCFEYYYVDVQCDFHATEPRSVRAFPCVRHSRDTLAVFSYRARLLASPRFILRVTVSRPEFQFPLNASRFAICNVSRLPPATSCCQNCFVFDEPLRRDVLVPLTMPPSFWDTMTLLFPPFLDEPLNGTLGKAQKKRRYSRSDLITLFLP